MKIRIKKREKKKSKHQKNTNKTRHIIAYILCKNHQIKEFYTNATKKFNLQDETYVIKGKCCFFKKVNGILELVCYYAEGNPNPFNLDNFNNNTGLEPDELSSYLDADLFKIIDECQNNDRRKYIFPLVVVCTSLCIMQLIISFLMGW